MFPSPKNVWVEKYRPTSFQQIIMDDHNRAFFRNIIAKNHFPNLLFYGPPGTGKTTTIINLINEYQDTYSRRNKTNILHLNASDERGIDIIRNQIYQFVKTKNLFEKGLKFIILDEVDYMTKIAQQALKNLLLTSNEKKCDIRYCLVCNYISKIDDGLKNEFIIVRFNQLPRAQIFELIHTIAHKERIPITPAIIESIQSIFGSDIRSMINYLQLNQQHQDPDQDHDQDHDQDQAMIVMDDEVFEKLLSTLSAPPPPPPPHHQPDTATPRLVRYFHDLVLKYNSDAKSIIVEFFNFSLKDTIHPANAAHTHINNQFDQWIDIFQILLDNDDIEVNTMIQYFVVKTRHFLTTSH